MNRLQDAPSSARKAGERCRYDYAFKRYLVAPSVVPGASVANRALDHRLKANILFKWRRSRLRTLAQCATKPAVGLLSVTVMEPEGMAGQAPAKALNPTSQRRPWPPASAGGAIEIEIEMLIPTLAAFLLSHVGQLGEAEGLHRRFKAPTRATRELLVIILAMLLCVQPLSTFESSPHEPGRQGK